MAFNKYDIIELLQMREWTVKFIKEDGSIREGVFTLESDKVPATKRNGKAESVHNDTLVTAYEVGKQQWRSFHADTVIEISNT